MGGGGILQNRGKTVEFGPKFQPLQQAHASQIVSHILRMWRLMRPIRACLLQSMLTLLLWVYFLADAIIQHGDGIDHFQ